MVAEAIVITRTGGPEVLEMREIEVPSPGPGEALIRQQAIGLNFIDVYHRNGLYPLRTLPSGIGMEGSGVVEAVGPGTTGLEVGMRVAYAGVLGAYVSRRIVPADRLVPVPDGVSSEQAAAVMLKGMTVEALVSRVYPVRPGQTVLWHAAAGGVGLIACQWLADLGVRVIGTVGTEQKAELARRHGCAETILYRKEDFASAVRRLTGGQGVPVVFDSVGKATFNGSLDCLQPKGMMVTFGNASGPVDPLDVRLLGTKGSLFLTRPTFFTYTTDRTELLASADAVFSRVVRGAISPALNCRWPLKDAASAHRSLESRETTGSCVLLP